MKTTPVLLVPAQDSLRDGHPPRNARIRQVVTTEWSLESTEITHEHVSHFARNSLYRGP